MAWRRFIPRGCSGRSVGVCILGANALLGGRAEAQEPPAPASAAATPSAKNQIDQYLAAAYENDTETRSRALAHQRRVLADRVEQVLGNFVDIGGYFRAGYGRNSRGGALTAFAAPGAGAKYRLGNEAENYGELIFGKNVYLPGAFRLNEDLRPDGTPSGPIARVQVRLSMVSLYATLGSGSATTFGLPEAWASIGNVFAAQPRREILGGATLLPSPRCPHQQLLLLGYERRRWRSRGRAGRCRKVGIGLDRLWGSERPGRRPRAGSRKRCRLQQIEFRPARV